MRTQYQIQEEETSKSCTSERMGENSNSMGNYLQINFQQNSQIISQQDSHSNKHSESSSFFLNDNLLKKIKDQSTKRKNKIITKQVMVKNPSFTNKRKLANDQSVLDPFLKGFKQSKYLKTTVFVDSKYRQLTFFDYKGKNENKNSKN